MELELRSVAPAGFDAWYAAGERAFGDDAHADDCARFRPLLDPDRTLAAYDGSHVVATAGALRFDLTVPGGIVPAAGVTMVSVQPTHRRRGVLTRLMHRQLGDLRAGGRDAVAALWASETPIYGRFGYGPASWVGTVTVPTRDGGFARPLPDGGRLRAVEPDRLPDEAGAAYDEQRRRTPGQVARTPPYWSWVLADAEHWRRGASSLRAVVHETAVGVRGYATYRVVSQWAGGLPRGSVRVLELIAADPQAHAALWRFLLDLDLMAEVTYDRVAPDDPLPFLLADSRQAQFTLRDGLWVRVLDVPRALTARRYAVAGDLVIDVTDPVLPDVAGRFALSGGPDGASCTPTRAAPDLSLGVADLGAVYLGGGRLDTLAAAGRVTEHTPGAAARAHAMFAWSPLPHQTWVF